MLHGRTGELRALDLLLSDAQTSRGGALIVRGAAGAGKTALLDHAARAARAAGMQVVRATALECESAIPFAGLSQILPLTLDASLSNSDRFSVGLAVLALLRQVAAGRSLVCVVDDAHWLDPASAEALSFAALRLDTAPVALLLASPADHPWTGSTRELILAPLDEADGAALLAERAPGLVPIMKRCVIAAAEGNPLALVEFARNVSTRPGVGRPQRKTITVRPEIAGRFLRPVRELPRETVMAMLICAAADVCPLPGFADLRGEAGDLAALQAAAERFGISLSSLSLAEHAGLVGLNRTGVKFTHPLVRMAVYQSACAADRMRAHRALAAVLPPASAVFHLAAAATGPDGATADFLERLAGGLRSRALAGEALEEAARLTSEPAARARRLLAAAAAAFDIGPARATAMTAGAWMAEAAPHGQPAGGLDDPVEALLQAGDDQSASILASALVAECRDRDMPGRLPYALHGLSSALRQMGDHQAAEAAAHEGLAVAREVAQPHQEARLSAILAWLAAARGEAVPIGDEMTPLAVWTAALLDLSLGRHGAALERLLAGPLHVLATPDLVEAAVRAGNPAVGREPLERFEEWAAGTCRAAPAGLALRSRALLATDAHHAVKLYSAAAELLGVRPYEQARTALLHGEALRRARHPTQARQHLRTAHSVFTELGAHPWAERARAELLATGVADPVEAGSLLTPQEHRVVRLAAGGAGNREIAAQLGISPRTVANHLYKAFPKLGVASRNELGQTFLRGERSAPASPKSTPRSRSCPGGGPGDLESIV
ncbi:AAA family ATPase [Microbispora sp. RL4-1S]|uniref:AAA family ATPase n=1 Tax=Microbispora oryzae TaxID=2806554 RepID=A0A940WS90_9ACTN|nr:helix-turn-helix transcriptional regulator [Microbispora oryzae]MBP2706101.1 AAA family ATPase [Microbispora oryzae]